MRLPPHRVRRPRPQDSRVVSKKTKHELDKLLDARCDSGVRMPTAKLWSAVPEEIKQEIKNEADLKWEHVLLHGRGRIGETALQRRRAAAPWPPESKAAGLRG